MQRLTLVRIYSCEWFIVSLSIFTGMLLVLFALFKLKVFDTTRTSSGVVGDKNNVFVIQ